MNDKVATNEAVVWVTQIPSKMDREAGIPVPMMNIRPAMEYGRIEVMMPPMTSFFATGDLIDGMRAKLKNYNYERGDCVLCLGDPAIIAVTGSILAERTSNYNLLIWDRLVRRYVKIKVAL